jgi:hypothetical protein
MSNETIQITPNPPSKTNWVKQIYFYTVIAISLLFICIGLFTFGKATLIKFVFPKADTNNIYMMPYTDPEQQCKNGQGSQYWYPKMAPISPDPTKPYTPPVPTEAEIKECIEVNIKGIAEQKERTFQSDSLIGLLVTIISAIVGGIHYSARDFFLRKE